MPRAVQLPLLQGQLVERPSGVRADRASRTDLTPETSDHNAAVIHLLDEEAALVEFLLGSYRMPSGRPFSEGVAIDLEAEPKDQVAADVGTGADQPQADQGEPDPRATRARGDGPPTRSRSAAERHC